MKFLYIFILIFVGFGHSLQNEFNHGDNEYGNVNMNMLDSVKSEIVEQGKND